MLSIFKGKHFPSGIVWLGVLLAVYYFAVFRPLAHRAAARSNDLTAVWGEFVRARESSAATAGLNLTNYSGYLEQLRQAATNLATAEQLARGRVEWAQDVRTKLNEPFWLIDFENERVQRIEWLARIAKENGVALEAGATNGLPQYTADMPQPVLLWLRLHLSCQSILAAVRCKVDAVRALNQLPSITHRVSAGQTALWEEIPIRLELVGSMEAVGRFLVTLPLRASELKQVGFGETLTNKPVVFINQIMLRKHSAERAHEVHLEASLSSFVPLEAAPAEPTAAKR